MKIAYVYGDGDYAALSFETDGYGTRLQELDKLIESNEFKHKPYQVEIKEFEHVDIAFVSWLKSSVLDADHCKHSNFYIIRESKSEK
jgi:hypothetical protein